MKKGSDIVSISDLSKKEIEKTFRLAKEFLPCAKGEEKTDLLNGKILGTLFFEPSTRTRLSFETAMYRLGGSVIGFQDQNITSATKGETIWDTMKVVDGYVDVIVIRHPSEGAARLAADSAEKPVINAGDGAGQHPTQTLLDLFTMKEEFGKIKDIKIALVGDLKYGRTAHSLALALSEFGAKLSFVAPKTLQMPSYILKKVNGKSNVEITEKISDVIENCDVLYVTRIQKERFPDPEEYKKVVDSYIINKDMLKKAPESLIVMHPLPRVNEISPDVDGTPHNRYFKQAFNGVPIRMALLAQVLGEK